MSNEKNSKERRDMVYNQIVPRGMTDRKVLSTIANADSNYKRSGGGKVRGYLTCIICAFGK